MNKMLLYLEEVPASLGVWCICCPLVCGERGRDRVTVTSEPWQGWCTSF